MIVSINQPAYLPWLAYFHRIAVSDVHIVLDHVQFEKNSFVNRNKVRTREGWCWLTVPVQTKGRFGHLPISQLEIAEGNHWARKHWETIRQSYAKAPHFGEHRAFFEEVFARPWQRLLELTQEINSYLLGQFSIRTTVVSSRQFNPQKTKHDLVLELCCRVGATVYLSGPLGRDYLDEEALRAAGIHTVYHDYKHPVYPQSFPGFEPDMAALDVLFNRGAECSAIMASGNISKEALSQTLT